MFQLFALVLLAFFAVSTTANTNFVKCFAGSYCDIGSLQTQPGYYYSAQDCADKCSGNRYFSYVPSSWQCLCSNSCKNPAANPNVDSYCYNPYYNKCWTNSYCGPNSAITTMPGIHNADSCAAACATKNSAFKFFNLVSNGQCQCNKGCSQLIASNGVNAYSMNGQACAVSN